MRIRWLIFGALIQSSLAFSGDLSLVTAGFSSQKQDDNKATNIELGGRFHEALEKNIEVYYFLGLKLRNYSEGGDSNGIEIGGGGRYYGNPFSGQILPYIGLQGWYMNDEDKLAQTKESGIYYSGLLGFRFMFNEKFFFDLEGELFNSSLTSSKTTSTTVGTVTTEETTKTTQVRVSSRNDSFFDSIKVGVGLKL
jgi:hypothetical protein